MDSRAKSKSERSLCEKSMQVVANIIRLSSLSVAQKSLGTAKTTSKGLSGSDHAEIAPEKEPLVPDQLHGNRRSQEPRSRANPTYVKPVGSNGSTAHVIHKERFDEVNPKKEECVDGLASEYIRKFRSKLIGCAGL